MVSTVSVVAQSNTVYEIPGLNTKSSLILEYNDSIDILYNKNGNSAFILVNKSSGMVIEETVATLDEVTDMEISGDMVYFCGETTTNQQVMGRFDINNLFFSSGSIEIFQIPISPTIGIYPGKLYLRKLEVYAPFLNDIHVFMVGDMIFNAPNNYPPDYTCLIDVYYNGTYWQASYIYQPGGDYLFDDLAVTANYLMVVGHKYTGGDYSHKAATLTPSTFPIIYPCTTGSIGPIPMYSSDPIYYFTTNRQLIEALDNDEYVILSYGEFEMNPGVVFSYYTSPGVLAYRWMVPNVTSTTEFRDLRKINGVDQLYVVPDHNNTVTKDRLYKSDYFANPGTLTSSQMEVLHSLDRRIGADGAIVSGETTSGHLGIWEAFYATDACAADSYLPLFGTVHPVSSWDMDEIVCDYIDISPIYCSTKRKKHQLSIICEN